MDQFENMDLEEFELALKNAPGMELKRIYMDSLKAVALTPSNKVPEKAKEMREMVEEEKDYRGGFYDPVYPVRLD